MTTPPESTPSADPASSPRRFVDLVDRQRLRIVAPLLPLLFFVPWIWRQVGRELAAPLFRDAAMVQYTGWCIRQGLRLYEDAATPDGPFIHFFHALLQVFWGTSDGGARRGDMVVQLLGAGLIGATLAPRPRLDGDAGTHTRDVLRIVWTLLGVFAWLPWYLTGGWEHTVQRDPYYALFGYLGMVLLYASGRFDRRGALAASFGGGLLVTLQLFTRQSGIIYPALALLALLAEGRDSPHWKARMRGGFAGAGAAIALMFGALLAFGSVRGFFFWYFTVPLDVYRYIGTKRFTYLYTHVYGAQLAVSVGIGLALLFAIARRWLPPRAVGFAMAPFLFLVAACLAGKGWVNHIQQTTAAVNLVILLALSEVWERGLERGVWGRRLTAMGVLLLCAFVGRVAMNLSASPFNKFIGYGGARMAAEQLGRDLSRTTEPEDRVFYYAHELHGPLLAGRKPAIPMVSDMVLNFEAWMRREPPEVPLTETQRATFERVQTELARDACDRLLASPPAAVVAAMNDLKTWSTISFEDDLNMICPAFVPVLESGYKVHTTASYHVYLRNDRANAPPHLPTPLR